MKVNESNNFEIARKVVLFLKNKRFTVFSVCLISGKMIQTPKTLPQFELANTVPGDFIIRGGLTSIPLSPSRSISWDISCEEVSISFDGDSVTIERLMPHDKTVLRVIA